MAISTEGIVNAKRKAYSYLSSGTKGNPFALAQIEQLFKYLAGHGANPDLQFVPFSNLTGDTVIADAASKIYAIFVKKQNTGTDAYFKAVNHASTAAGTTFEICIGLNLGNDVAVLIFPRGLVMGTGITLVSSTTDVGNTDSSSGDGPDGFFLIGAP